MLPSPAIQADDVLETGYMSLDVGSLINNEYSLLMLDKPSRRSFVSPLPSKQENGVARQLLQLRRTFRVRDGVRADRGQMFTADLIQAFADA